MSEDFSDTPIEKNSPESWAYSRNYAALFGDVPASFITTTRALIADQEKRGGAVSPSSRFLALRLLRGRNLKAPFYYAVMTYRQELIAGSDKVSDDDLLKAFQPIETAGLFGIIYLYKKAKKLCDPGEWAFVHKSIMRETEVAGLVGTGIPGIGLANALFTSTLRHIALTTFLRFNVKHFQEYRRSLKPKSSLFCIEQQMNYWGCTDLQIASIFLQVLGFGINFSNSFCMDLSGETPLTKTEKNSSPFRVTELWVKALLDTGREPQIIHDTNFYPKRDGLEKMIAAAKLANEERSNSGWLDKTTEDVNPQSTPQLFSGTQAEPPAEPEFESLPDEIKKDISREEWEEEKDEEI